VCSQVGVIEDTENRERLSKLLRFHSSKSETDMVGLQEYVGRMKEGQKGIYYMVRHHSSAAAAAAAGAAACIDSIMHTWRLTSQMAYVRARPFLE
jgi:HSP90 family molecular chaperone